MRDVRDYFNRIQARLLLAFGVVLAGTLLLAWFGLRSIGQASDEAVARIGALQENLQTASELQVTILRQVQSGEHYVLDGDSLSRARFRDLGAEARTLLARYAQLPGLTADARKNVARIAAVRQRLEGEYLAAEALREDGNLDAAAARLETAEPMVAELGTLLRGLARTQSTQIEDVTRLIQGDSDVRRLAFLIILPLAIVIALYVVLRTVATIHRPLNRLVLAANQFGDGNLNVRVSGVMPTELRVLANAFGDMADRLRNIVGETVTTAEHIRISASDLSSISEEVAASSGEVASAMVEITSGAETQAVGLRTVDEALDVIRARAAEVSGAADDLQQLGRQIRQLAEERREEIGRALRVLLEVRGVVTAAGREVEALDESSKSISSFVEAIQGIARQTHLLALNAAIEAARAGEHGRGFAVVAEEVRKLADGSARAAEEVSSSVRAIRGELRGVVETITEGVTRVAGVEEVSKGAEAAFEDIIGAVAKVHEAAERLAMAAAGNGGAVATVESTVRAVGSTAESHAASAQQVSAAAEEQSAATEHMSAASMELLHSAERLKDLVRGFRV